MISSHGCQCYSKTECHSGGLGRKVIQKMYCPPVLHACYKKLSLAPSPAWCSVSGGRSLRLASASVLPHVSPSPCLTPPPLAADKSEAGDQSGGGGGGGEKEGRASWDE